MDWSYRSCSGARGTGCLSVLGRARQSAQTRQRVSRKRSRQTRGELATLSCTDSDAAIRALLSAYPGARDIEIAAAGLEEAFLELTGEGAEDL